MIALSFTDAITKEEIITLRKRMGHGCQDTSLGLKAQVVSSVEWGNELNTGPLVLYGHENFSMDGCKNDKMAT